MNTLLDADRFTTEQLQRLHDLAHREAPQLRSEAIDDFWRSTDAVLSMPWQRARRAAERLAHRIRRHDLLRSAAS